MASEIAYQSPLAGGTLLETLLGSRARTTGNTSGTTAGSTTGSQTGLQTGSSTASTTTSANIDPLMAIFNSASQGMTPEMMSTLISSIFQEGSQQVPALIGAYANATGSRATGNSGTRLALDELNRGLSTQAAQAIMNYNQQGQQTAANAAGRIADSTRATTQTAANTQANSGTTQQNQVQTQQQQTQQQQVKGANPNMAAMLGLGGTALNFADKKGWLDFIKSSKTPDVGSGVGTITGGGGITGAVGAPAPSFGAPAPQSYSMGAAPAPSAGLVQQPGIGGVGGAPSTVGGAAPGGFAAMPAVGVGGGITDYFGAPSAAGSYGGLANFDFANNSFGGLGNFNAFDIGGTGSLGSNIPAIPAGTYDYGSGITDFGGGSGGTAAAAAGNNFGGFGDYFDSISSAADSAASSVGSFLGGIGGGLGDLFEWGSSFFSDGGSVVPQIRRIPAKPAGYADGGVIGGQPFRLPGIDSNPLNYTSPAIQYRPEVDRYAAANGLYADGGVVKYTDGGVSRKTFEDTSLSDVVPGTPKRYADGGGIGAVGDGRYGAPALAGGAQPMPMAGLNPVDIFQFVTRRRNEAAGLQQPPQQLQQGTRTVTQQQYMPLSSLLTTLPLLIQSMMPQPAMASGFADGGQVQTGGVTRNRNNMGAPVKRQQQAAINYDGYAPAPAAAMPTLGVGASIPSAVAPSGTAAINAPSPQSAPAAQALTVDPRVMGDALTAYMAARNPGPAGGMIMDNSAGDAATSGQNEADNGAAGIGPSGVAGSGIGAAGMSTALGLVAPSPMPGIVSMIAAIAQAVNAANQANASGQGNAAAAAAAAQEGAVSSPVSQSNVVGIDIGMLDGATSSGGDNAASASNAGTGTSGDTGEGDGAGPGGGGGAGSGAGPGYKDGGMVRGPGTGTSDSIPVKSREPGGKQIYYSDDEFVFPADVVAQIGKHNLQSMLDAFHSPVNR